jgi:large subunit ribosomal protein L9
MKVLLIKDVYKLGRAGDVKKVADGYGRNYLLPQGMAVLATPGALKQAEFIRSQAEKQRKDLNQEMSGVAERINGLVLTFPVRASETGKLYGSISTQMIAETLSQKAGLEVSRRQMDIEPLRSLGQYQVPIRLTVDLIPEVTVIVHREGESPSLAAPEAAEAGSGGLEEDEEVEELEGFQAEETGLGELEEAGLEEAGSE